MVEAEDLQVAAAANVGEGDAAELWRELFPGTGEGAVRIVRAGGCGHTGQRGDGFAGNNICRCDAESGVVCPKLQVALKSKPNSRLGISALLWKIIRKGLVFCQELRISRDQKR